MDIINSIIHHHWGSHHFCIKEHCKYKEIESDVRIASQVKHDDVEIIDEINTKHAES